MELADRSLILHFDINKTILLFDSVKSGSMEHMINSLFSECAWGTFDPTIPFENRTIHDWNLVSSVLSSQPPCENVVTYAEFLEFHSPTPQNTRRSVKNNFTCPGEKGTIFREKYDTTLMRVLPLQNDAKECFYILPSFFELILYLEGLQINYEIVFRTFGTDGDRIIEEYNRFCENKHPLFHFSHRLDGSNGARDRRIHFPYDTACFLRHGSENEDLFLCIVDESNMVSYKRGPNDISNYLFTQFESGKSLLIRDCYEYWRDHNESDESGKVFLIDPRESSNFLQVFFDDNIERHKAHIVDVRDYRTFESICFEESNNKFIKKAEPYEAIWNQHYFIDALRSMLALQGIHLPAPLNGSSSISGSNDV